MSKWTRKEGHTQDDIGKYKIKRIFCKQHIKKPVQSLTSTPLNFFKMFPNF